MSTKSADKVSGIIRGAQNLGLDPPGTFLSLHISMFGPEGWAGINLPYFKLLVSFLFLQ